MADVNPVQLRINGRDVTETGPPNRTFGSYAALEVVDGDYVDRHFPQDSSGNAYRGRRDEAPADFGYRGEEPQAYQNSYFKETNESQDDWSDLIRLTRVLSETPKEEYAERVREVIHVREWLNHVAVMAIMDNRESGINTGHGDDYYIYRGMKDPRFFLIPHDLDSILGQGFGRSAVDATIWGPTKMATFDRFLRSPEFKPKYFRALRRQMKTTFSEERFGAVAEQTLASYVPWPVIDHLKSFVEARKESIRERLPSESSVSDETGPSVSIAAPGEVNQTLPSLRINEVLALNETVFEHQGEFPDVVELKYSGEGVMDLSGMSLTDDPTTRRQFVFGPNTTIESGEHKLLLGGGAEDAEAEPPRLGFGLDGDGEGLYLYDTPARGGELVDSVSFGHQVADTSIGRLEEGAWRLNEPTPGAPNVGKTTAEPQSVRLNEWLSNPSGNRVTDDFIELFNPTELPVDLSGLYLSDNPWGAPEKFRIPEGTFIAPQRALTFTGGGGDAQETTRLNFNLSSNGEHLGIVDVDGTKIDQVVYDPQGVGVSEGRSPSGEWAIREFNRPSPEEANPGPMITRHTEEREMIPLDAQWRFHQRGEDPGVGWQELGFDEKAGWESGRSVFHRVFKPLPIDGNTRLEFQKPPQSTFYFRHKFDYSGSTSGAVLALRHIIDDGVVVHLNDRRIYDWNMKPGTPTYSTPAASAVGDPFVSRPVLIPGTALREGENVLAAELHQASGSKDGVFGMSLEVNVTVTNRLHPKIRLNEIMVRGNRPDMVGGPGPNGDWIEVVNPRSKSVELSGIGLTDDPERPGRWRFPEGAELEPGEYAVIQADGTSAPSDKNTGFGLDLDGEGVYLYERPDSEATVIDAVEFGLQIEDYSIGRLREAGNRWALGKPTPGQANAKATLGDPNEVRINEWLALNDDGADWLELYNPEPKPVSLSGLFLSDDVDELEKSSLPKLSYLGTERAAFRQIIADENAASGADHVGFALSGDGESIVISDARAHVIDTVHFEAQLANRSEGRFPDGGERLVRFPEGTVTPGSSNVKDSDGDGMPDFWELEFGLNSELGTDKGLDRDGDGASNLDEFRAGTNPRDAESVLRLRAIRLRDETDLLRFKTSEGRQYTLQARESLSEGSWQNVNEINGEREGGVVEISVPAGVTRYYRVVAHGFGL